MMVFYLVVIFAIQRASDSHRAFLSACKPDSVTSDIKKRINITRVQMRDAGKLAGTTVAGIEMIETIKASGAENGFFEKWAGYQASVNTNQVRFQRMNQILGLLPQLISSVCGTAVLMTGVFLAMKGEFTVGMIMAFQGFLSSFVSPAMTLISAGQSLQEMRTVMERIEDVMKYPTDTVLDAAADENAEYDKLSGNIELKNVTFGYSRLADPLIENFSMTLRQRPRGFRRSLRMRQIHAFKTHIGAL